MKTSVIQNKIYEIRKQKVMLDYDLAEIYEVETKALNQAVKRNAERFPEDFMFRLTSNEWEHMRSQFLVENYENHDITNDEKLMWSQFVTTSGDKSYPSKRPKIATLYAFTEHGVTMLAGILKSEKAIKMNIAIVRAFISLRRFAINYAELAKEIEVLKEITGNHNAQLNQIYDALENLMDEKAEQKKWAERERIGFKPIK